MAQPSHNAMYFEDFEVGDLFRHSRGKTMTEMDHILMCNLVMNTASAHFDEAIMADHMFKTRVVYGGITISMVLGLAAQDTAENAIAELSMDNIRLRHPVFHNDTLYAFTRVEGIEDGERDDAGIVSFHHWGMNQDDKIVFEGDRRTLIKRRSHWGS
ncbi:MAG: MaoC family dehydratase [Pseudomonadota bacterium]